MMRSDEMHGLAEKSSEVFGVKIFRADFRNVQLPHKAIGRMQSSNTML
jgi:hypothetical protein